MSQMTRLLALFAVLLALAGAVGLYAWKGVFEKDKRDEHTKDVNERLFAAGKADEKNSDGGTVTVDFTRLVMTTPGESTTLEREPGEAWKIVQPVQASADKVTLEGVTSSLQTSKFKYVADESPDEAALEKYGLKDPAFTVEAEALVGDSHEKRTAKLKGGAENPFNGSIFMQREGEKQVWAAEGGVKWGLQKTTFELRDKEIFALDDLKVKKIDVKNKGTAYSLERDAEKNWHVRFNGADAGFLGDPSVINSAISGLKNEKAISFPPAGAAAVKPLGLDAPDTELTFDLGEVAAHIVMRKSVGDGGDQTYAYREGAGTRVLAEVPVGSLSHFDRSVEELRDKTVSFFKKDAATKIAIHIPENGAADLVVEKDASVDAGSAETWKMTSPRVGPSKQFTIAALIWTIGSIKYTKVVDAKPKDLKKYGLDSARQITLFGADGKELTRLSLGKDVPGEKAGTKYLRGAGEAVYQGDASRIAELPTRIDQLLESPPAPKGDAGP